MHRRSANRTGESDWAQYIFDLGTVSARSRVRAIFFSASRPAEPTVRRLSEFAKAECPTLGAGVHGQYGRTPTDVHKLVKYAAIV